ncbi:hypothetical protein J4429_00605 [Candidatus Pacearchaeota archaeon]|nr:hypothetical protein [uncultured archaeon]AQS32535.1 hypothetical protein [uncultured archaeon]AQS33095.1 hypothetical protein [uncultured archaeon]MBS3074938.1 hypothetical protein [Candidatus Pacearchaeota archaeon]
MVNQVILDYLSRYSGMYKLEDLKNKIIATGYSPQEVDEASGVLGLEGGVEKNDLQFQALEEKFAVKTFKWMKFGGIIGIIFLTLGIIGSIASIILPILYTQSFDGSTIEKLSSFFVPLIIIITILFLLFSLVSIVFCKGFAKMGEFCESKLLKYSSLAFIFLIILFIILGLIFIVFLMIFGNEIANSLLETGNTGRGLSVGIPTGSAINVTGAYFGIFGFVLITGVFLLFFIVFINMVLFFIGLVQAGKKARFAKIAGISGLMLFLVFIGFGSLFLNPLLLIAISASKFGVFFIGSIFLSLGCLVLLFMSLSLFDVSRKFEG